MQAENEIVDELAGGEREDGAFCAAGAVFDAAGEGADGSFLWGGDRD